MTPDEGRERGEKQAERGIKRAAFYHEEQILRGLLLFVEALLASPTECATLDDATPDLRVKHADGGKWRASIPKRLLAAQIIVADTVAKSNRPARHAGYLTRWRLINRPGAERFRDELNAILKTNAGEPVAADSPAVDSITHQSNGEKNDGQAL